MFMDTVFTLNIEKQTKPPPPIYLAEESSYNRTAHESSG